MSVRQLRVLIPALVLVTGASLALALSSGPPAAATGMPAVGGKGAELSCNRAGCHSGNPVNQSGSLEILGVPAQYVPGNSYPITVRLASTTTTGNSGRRWGFQLTTVALGTGLGAGTYQLPAELQTVAGANQRVYVEHTSSALRQGTASPAEWTFTWLAPPTAQGAIGFYAAGNAANGDFTNGGDHIYTVRDTTQVQEVPVESVSWGRLKSRNFSR